MSNNLVCIGSGNTSSREQNDYYATDPVAAIELMTLLPLSNVWECACGGGHLAQPMARAGILNKATDLVYRGYGVGGVDFLQQCEPYDGDIVTNPPFRDASEFVRNGMKIIRPNRYLCLFLKLQFLESQQRANLFKFHPPKCVYVSRRRIMTAKNGDFEAYSSSALAYAWFVWQKGYEGRTIVDWFN